MFNIMEVSKLEQMSKILLFSLILDLISYGFHQLLALFVNLTTNMNAVKRHALQILQRLLMAKDM